MLTTKQYAEQYGVSQRTVQRWIKSGQLLADKRGNKFYISEDQTADQTAITPPDTLPEGPRAQSKFVSTKDYAQSLGVSQRTVQRWIVEGKIDAVREGKRYRIEVAVVPEPEAYAPEQVDDTSDDEDLPITDEGKFDARDLRQEFSSKAQADIWRAPIGPSNFVIRNRSGLYRVIVDYEVVYDENPDKEDENEDEE